MADVIRPIRNDDDDENYRQVAYPRHLTRYTRANQDRMPVPRKREIRREGFLGLQQNQQDKAHDKRVRAIENKALQTDYFLQGATHLEYRAVKRNVEAVDAMEREIVDQTQAGTATAAFAEELWNDAANRLRAIQDEGIRIYHSEGRKILEEEDI